MASVRNEREMLCLVCRDRNIVECSMHIARLYFSTHLPDDDCCENAELYVTKNLFASTIERLVKMLEEYANDSVNIDSAIYCDDVSDAIDMFHSSHFLDLPLSGLLANMIFLRHVKDNTEAAIIAKFGPHLAGFLSCEDYQKQSHVVSNQKFVRILNEHQWAFLLRYWKSSQMKAVRTSRELAAILVRPLLHLRAEIFS